MAEGTKLGQLWGEVAQSGGMSDRIVSVRIAGEDVRIDVTGGVFEWANSSVDEGVREYACVPRGRGRLGACVV